MTDKLLRLLLGHIKGGTIDSLLSASSFDQQMKMHAIGRYLVAPELIEDMKRNPVHYEKMLPPPVFVSGDQQHLSDGDRVYTFDYAPGSEPSKHYGTPRKDEGFQNGYDWYIAYDDGQEFVVLEQSLCFKG